MVKFYQDFLDVNDGKGSCASTLDLMVGNIGFEGIRADVVTSFMVRAVNYKGCRG